MERNVSRCANGGTSADKRRTYRARVSNSVAGPRPWRPVAGGSTEILMHNWVATGLGFALNHVEEALGDFFRLRGGSEEYIEFSTEPLLRSAFKDRMDDLAKGLWAESSRRTKRAMPNPWIECRSATAHGFRPSRCLWKRRELSHRRRQLRLPGPRRSSSIPAPSRPRRPARARLRDRQLH
jgi:hypothetical protein